MCDLGTSDPIEESFKESLFLNKTLLLIFDLYVWNTEIEIQRRHKVSLQVVGFGLGWDQRIKAKKNFT